MSDIKVAVVEFGDRKFLQAQWVDPDSRRKKTKSTGTTNRKEADRFAAKLEADLQNGRHKNTPKTTWAGFRQLYEDDVLPGLAEKTGIVYCAVFNHVERILSPQRLADLTAARLSHLQARWRDAGRSEATIRTYSGTLGRSLEVGRRYGNARGGTEDSATQTGEDRDDDEGATAHNGGMRADAR